MFDTKQEISNIYNILDINAEILMEYNKAIRDLFERVYALEEDRLPY